MKRQPRRPPPMTEEEIQRILGLLLRASAEGNRLPVLIEGLVETLVAAIAIISPSPQSPAWNLADDLVCRLDNAPDQRVIFRPRMR